MSVLHPCVCCGHLTMGEPPGSYEICSVCFWEDDIVQLRWPDWSGGANRPHLIEAQQNFRRFGAVEERFVAKVRPPAQDEPLTPGWRRIDLDRDEFEPIDVALAPWPDDRTRLYWWRNDGIGFWRQ